MITYFCENMFQFLHVHVTFSLGKKKGYFPCCRFLFSFLIQLSVHPSFYERNRRQDCDFKTSISNFSKTLSNREIVMLRAFSKTTLFLANLFFQSILIFWVYVEAGGVLTRSQARGLRTFNIRQASYHYHHWFLLISKVVAAFLTIAMSLGGLEKVKIIMFFVLDRNIARALMAPSCTTDPEQGVDFQVALKGIKYDTNSLQIDFYQEKIFEMTGCPTECKL